MVGLLPDLFRPLFPILVHALEVELVAVVRAVLPGVRPPPLGKPELVYRLGDLVTPTLVVDVFDQKARDELVGEEVLLHLVPVQEGVLGVVGQFFQLL